MKCLSFSYYFEERNRMELKSVYTLYTVHIVYGMCLMMKMGTESYASYMLKKDIDKIPAN